MLLIKQRFLIKLITMILAIITFFLFSSAFAWNTLGHMVVANIAYQYLTPKVREQTAILLTAFQQEYPQTNFSQLAAWPDFLRAQKIEIFSHWHYINLPFSDDGTAITNTIDADNATWAFNHIKTIVENDRANVYERARFLAFLMHITADLHQPLHTVARLSAAYPEGDHGGNVFWVRYNNERVNLHRLWDGGVGVLEMKASQENVEVLTKMLTTLYPPSYFAKQTNELDADHWARAGLSNAQMYVYQTTEEQTVSVEYLASNRKIAQQQLALAGYRLANVLNQLFD